MVEADPDVPYAFTCVIDKLGERRDLRELEALGRPLRTEDGRARGYPVFESQQSSVLRIEVAQRDVPLSSDVRPFDADGKIAVAWLVRERGGSDQQKEYRWQRFHRLS